MAHIHLSKIDFGCRIKWMMLNKNRSHTTSPDLDWTIGHWKKGKQKIQKWGWITEEVVEDDHRVTEIQAKGFKSELVSQHRVCESKSTQSSFWLVNGVKGALPRLYSRILPRGDGWKRAKIIG
jgi:hypothetical protein